MARCMALALSVASAAALVAATAATGAAASTPVAGHPAPSVVVMRVGSPLGVKPIHRLARVAATSSQLTLHSAGTAGVVAVTPKVYLVFWGSQWSKDPAGAAPALQNFFTGLYGSADTWGTILSQYCQGLAVGTVLCGSAGTHVVHPTSTVLAGVWFDNASAEPSKASTTQLAAEAAKAATHFGNTTQTSNQYTQYVIASPTGTHPNNFPNAGFCAWHSSTSTSAGTLAYTNLPYVPDLGAGGCTTLASPTLLDGYFSTESHEYAETVTDLWPSKGWLASNGSEIGDLCVNLDGRLTLPTGTFDVQGIWSNVATACVTSG
jgi:hypothetical protein